MARTILFTGGGTAGHVTVNLALIPLFLERGWTVHYMGSANGIEAELIRPLRQVEYHVISTGKLRRYASVENLKDPFRVAKGVLQAYRKIRQLRPHVVFSKGGFVSVPVVIAASMNRVPAVIHESDLTPGLANRISAPFAAKICHTFPETGRYLKASKSVHIGPVIRPELKRGKAIRGYHLCDFVQDKPVVLIMGGSQGSQKINRAVREILPELTGQFQVVHICGKGQLDTALKNRGYKQFEYVHDELADLLAMADLVVSRAGSNSICEFLTLQKPMLLIPLSRSASRGDQIDNARSFQQRGYCEVLQEEEMTNRTLLDGIRRTYERREELRAAMKDAVRNDPLTELANLITSAAKPAR